MEAVRIRGIATGGDGVGTLADGLTVFVPRTAPGDTVEISGLRRQRSFARGRIQRVVTPGPDRAVPRCPHYERDLCGGCQLQHLEAAAQRAARQSVTREALRRIGGVEVEVPEIQPSTAEWDYRAKITLTARAGRIGYHPIEEPRRVFELDHCHVARPELMVLWRRLREHRRLLPSDLDSLVLRVDRVAELHVIARTAGSRAWTDARSLHRALHQDGLPAFLWWQPERGAARVVAGGSDAYPATVFEQIHSAMGDRVRRHALLELGAKAGQLVWDLYAGIGETTTALAVRGVRVESVEADSRAVTQAERAGPLQGVLRHVGMVEDLIDRLGPAESAIVNPPRAGLSREVSASLLLGGPARVVYISCDPATLARDVARLAPAYRLSSASAFDLFPQTAHVEVVARFDRP